MSKCAVCLRRKNISKQRSHAMNATKKEFKVNVQKISGKLICSRCLKTSKKV